MGGYCKYCGNNVSMGFFVGSSADNHCSLSPTGGHEFDDPKVEDAETSNARFKKECEKREAERLQRKEEFEEAIKPLDIVYAEPIDLKNK